MLTDQCSIFLSSTWRGLCSDAEITLRHTGVESHNSLNVGETVHNYLRRIFLKVRDSHPGLSEDLCLSLSVQAMNESFNADGLCPTLLVFGVLPKLPNRPHNLLQNADRFRALQIARKEYGQFIAHERNKRASRSQPPTEHLISPGDMVYVYRERPQKWVGPVRCIHRDGKQIQVAVGNGGPVCCV
jgi:hypothetical protein